MADAFDSNGTTPTTTVGSAGTGESSSDGGGTMSSASASSTASEGSADSADADPSDPDTSASDPSTTDPSATDPSATDPATTDPSTTDPSTTDPSDTEGSSGPPPMPICGDGSVDPAEECDGDANGAECLDAGYLGGGTIACAADCTFDTALCNGPICGVQDDGAGECPPECSSCAGGVCIFDCPGNIIDGGPCNGLALVCPAGWPCSLLCGDAGCVDTTFTCSDGVCTVDCDGIDACDNTQVSCGLQSCTATCDIFTEPALDCGESCDCVEC